MSRSKHMSAYPIEFQAMFETAIIKRVFIWPRADHKCAMKDRFMLYGYIKAVERKDPQLADRFRTVKLTLDGEKIIFTHRDFTAEAESIRQALGMAPQGFAEGDGSPDVIPSMDDSIAAAEDNPVAAANPSPYDINEN